MQHRSRVLGAHLARRPHDVYQLDIAILRAVGNPTAVGRAIPRTILLLGVVSCLTDISSEMVASILPIYLLAHLQFSPLQFGVVDGLYQGVSAIARLASGIASDRGRHHKGMAVFGYALSAVCKAGLLVASTPTAFAATIAVDRCGKGVRTAPRDAMISLSARGANLATAFGVHRAFDTLGVVIGPLAAYALLRDGAGRFDQVFVVSLAVALAGVGVLVFLVDDTREALPGRRTSVRAMLSAVAIPDFRAVALAGVLLNVTVMSDAFLYLILQRQGDGALSNLPLYYLGTSASFLAFAIPAGRLADRVGRARVYLGGHVVLVGVYAVVLLAGTLDGIAVLAVLCGHGAYYAATDGVLAALASSLVPKDAQGTGLGAVATGTSLAKLASSVLLGLTWTWVGPVGVVLLSAVSTSAVLVWAAMVLTRLDRADANGTASLRVR